MTKKVKSFFHVFSSSILPRPDYYRKIVRTSFLFSLKYIASLICLLNLIFLILFAIRLNPIKINYFLQNLSYSLEKFPENLIIDIHKGKLITTYNRPYFLWLNHNSSKSLLLVIDETATPQKIKQYKAPILLTANKFVFSPNTWKNEDSFETLPLTYVQDQKIDRALIRRVNETLTSIHKLFFPLYFSIMSILFVILIPISLLTLLLYMFFSSFIVFLLFKVISIKDVHSRYKTLHFKKTLQIGFHAITLPLLLDYGLMSLNLKSRPLPFLFFFLLVLFIFAGVYEAYFPHEKETHHPTHSPHKKHTH